MKRSLIVIVLLLTVAYLGFSQKLFLGPRVSFPVGWATGEDWDALIELVNDEEKYADYGLLIGLELTYYFSERFSAEVAALWGIYNWGFEGKPGSGKQTDFSCGLDFLEVPIVASYRIPLGRGAVTMGAGPLLIFPTGNFVIDQVPDPPPGQEEIGEEVDNLFVIGATAGLGYDYPIGPRGILSVDARYVRNITKFFEEDGGREFLPEDFDEFYINAVSLYLSYGFAIGGRNR
jgi:hypothetical protein